MPEPVVIIGPAPGPAGPVAGPAGKTPDHVPEESTQPAAPAGPALARRILAGTARLLGRIFMWVAITLLGVIRRNPRNSLAAGASFMILGAIWFTQVLPGKAKHDPPANAIGGKASGSSAKDQKTASAITPNDPSSGAGTATTPDPSDKPAPAPAPAKLVDASTPDKPKADNPGTSAESNSGGVTGPTDAVSGLPLPAPKPAGVDEPILPAATVANAPTPEGPPKPTGEPTAAPGEVTSAPQSPPAAAPAKDVTTATLLPAPALTPASPVAQTTGGQTDGGHAGSAKAKAAAVFDSLAPLPTSGPPLTAAASLPGDDPSISAAAADAAGKTRKPDTAGSNTASSPPEKQPGLPEEPKPPAGEKPTSELVKSQPAGGDSKLEPLALPDPSSPKPGAGNTEPERSEVARPESSKGANSDSAGSALSANDKPPGEPKLVPLTPPGAVALPTSASGSASPSDQASAKRPEAGSVAGETGGVFPFPTEPKDPVRSDTGPAIPVPKENSVQSGGLGSSSSDPKLEVRAEPPAGRGSPDPKVVAREEPTPGRGSPDATPGRGSPDLTAERGSPDATAGRGSPEPAPANPTSPPVTVQKDGTRWIPIPNTGKIPVDGSEEPEAAPGAIGDESGQNRRPARDPRAHAAKDMNFETAASQPELPTPEAAETSRALAASTAGARTALAARSGGSAERVESTPHIVERDENFWTISRQYYSSGRYYRALWKSNEAKYPDINVLHVGDVITIPAIEDLDPALILPARSPAPAAAVARTGRASGSSDGNPSKRVRQTDPDLDLPAPESTSRGGVAARGNGAHSDRGSTGDDRNDDEPETRTVARPRSIGAAPRRPVYKVRLYDTLRSIARDKLGDSRRSTEILDLNRDLIDDPSQLIVGQVLELPEDARTSLRRTATR
jgi:nucleoid-associated protein YgaU